MKGQGEGESSTERAALRFSTSAHVPTLATLAGGVGLLKYLTHRSFMLHIQFQS